jgi:hypothetical protein
MTSRGAVVPGNTTPLARRDASLALHGRGALTVILGLMIVASLFAVDWSRPILHARGLAALAEMVGAAFTHYPESSRTWRTLR